MFRGGVAGSGSFCGALPAAVYTIGLVTDPDTQMKLVKQLMAWFLEAPFPQYQPAGMDLPPVVAKSDSCRDILGLFMEATGFELYSPGHGAFCGGLTADVARYTAELLNKQA